MTFASIVGARSGRLCASHWELAPDLRFRNVSGRPRADSADSGGDQTTSRCVSAILEAKKANDQHGQHVNDLETAFVLAPGSP